MPWIRRILIAAASVAALLALLVVLLFTVDLGFLKPVIESSVERLTGRELEIAGDLHIELGATTRIELNDGRFGNPEWATDRDMIAARRIEVHIELASVLDRPLVLEDVEIEGGRVNIEVGEGKRNNWTFRERPADAPPKPKKGRHPLPILLEQGYSRDFEFTYRNPYWVRPLKIAADVLETRIDDNGLLDTETIGNINGRPVRLSGRIGPFGNLIMATQVDIEAEGELDTLYLKGGGFIDDFANPVRPNVEVSIKGPSLADVTQMIGFRSLGDGKVDVVAGLVESDLGIELDLKGKVGRFNIDAAGEATNLRDLDKLKFRADASGPNLGRALRLFGIEYFPEEPYMFSTRLSRSGESLVIEKAGLRLGDSEFSLGGTASQFPTLKDADFALSVQGNDIAKFRELIRLPGIATGPFRVDATLNRQPGGNASTDIRLTTALGQAQVNGEIGQPPSFVGTQVEISGSGDDLSTIGKAIGLNNVMPNPWTIGGALAVTDGGISLTKQLVLEADDERLVARGDIGFRPLDDGTDLRLDLTGDDIRELAAIVGGDREVPADSYEIAGRLKVSESRIELSETTATIGEHRFGASGTITREPGAAGSSLEISASGPDLTMPIRAAGVDTEKLPREQYDVTGGIGIRSSHVDLRGIVAKIGSNRLRLDGKVGTGTDLDGTDLRLNMNGPRIEEVVARAGDFERLLGEYSASALLAIGDGSATIDDGRISIGQLDGTIEGRTTWPIDTADGFPEQGRLTIDVSGPDFAAVLPKNEWFTPDPSAFELKLRGDWQDERLTIDSGSFRLDDATLSISGELDQPPDWSATSMQARLEVASLKRLGLIRGERLPERPAMLQAEFQGDARTLRVENFNGTVGPSDFRGQLQVELGDRPRVDLELRSGVLDVRAATEDEFEEAREESEARPSDGYVIPDTPLPLESLRKIDAGFDIVVDSGFAGPFITRGFLLKGELEDGALRIDRFENESAAGTWAGKASLTPLGEDSARLEGDIELADVYIGITSETEEDFARAPRYDGNLVFSADGATVRELAADLSGESVISWGKGQIRNQRISIIYGDFITEVFNSINPFTRREEFTTVECGAILLYADDGVVLTDPSFVIQTDKMNILAQGTINLNTERLDFNFRTAARGAVGISAGDFINPYIRVGGSLSRPRLALDTRSTVVTGAAAVATAGLSLIAKPLWDRAFRDQDPCGTVMKEGEIRRNERLAGG